jgi:cell division protein FtsQ
MTISDEMTDTEIRPLMDPRMWQRRVEVTRANGQRRLRLLTALLVACVLGLAAVIAVHSPLFAAKHVQVVGALNTPAAEIRDAAGLAKRPPLVDINAIAAAHGVEKLPWVLSATVAVHWPDSVTVKVTERKPIAAVGIAGRGDGSKSNSADSWALVDGSGRVLAYVSAVPTGLFQVDVPTKAGPPGTQSPVLDQWGVDVAASIPTSLRARVRSIDVSSLASPSSNGVASSGSVSLALSGDITAVIGPPVELPAKYEALESMFAGAPLQTGDVVDVTVPDEPTVSAPPVTR